jgi:multisubunit Na+/H+ antiporter MnhG subunit
MAVPDTFWLTLTNILLGAVVVLCILAVTACVTYEIISRAHKRHADSVELDRDMRRWFGGAGPPPAHHAGLATWWHRHH